MTSPQRSGLTKHPAMCKRRSAVLLDTVTKYFEEGGAASFSFMAIAATLSLSSSSSMSWPPSSQSPGKSCKAGKMPLREGLAGSPKTRTECLFLIRFGFAPDSAAKSHNRPIVSSSKNGAPEPSTKHLFTAFWIL